MQFTVTLNREKEQILILDKPQIEDAMKLF